MIIETARDLCLQLAPELPKHFYVLECPSALPKSQGVIAYAIDGPCPTLERHLKSCGEWCGRGPAILFCDPPYRGEASLGILLHELSHVVPFRSADYGPSVSAFDERQIAAFTKNPTSQSPQYPAWHPSHHKTFVRCALHIWWRAALRGKFVALEDLHICGRDHDLSPVGMYWEALANEPVTLLDKSFSDILAAPAPEAFDALWTRDIADWLTFHPEIIEQLLKE